MKIDRWKLYEWIRNVQNRKVIIFGTDESAERLYYKLKLMDIKVEYFVDDVLENEKLCGCDIRNYYELLYEDIDKIGIVISRIDSLEKLFEIGVCTRQNIYNCLLLFGYNPLNGLYPNDPTIGYNIFGESEYPGFVLFGSRGAERTIITLGGSTTDAVHSQYHTNHKIKSWSEILSDKLNEAGISVRILCGGVAGYKSSQELLKLIRDAVPLCPDMIITYNGFNDIVYACKYPLEQANPFLHHHQKILFQAIKQSKKEKGPTSEYTFGIASNWGAYTGWKNAVKMMHLICEGYDIKHIAVLQPSFYNQLGKFGGNQDAELWMHAKISDEHLKLFDLFFHEKDIDVWCPEWVKDLRDLFCGMDGIFYDLIHVEEIGNEIIADKMFEYVKENLPLI